MWWLLKADASKKSADQNTFPLGDPAVKWVKVDLNEEASLITQQKSSKPPLHQPHKGFLIREIKKPDRSSLRLPLQNLGIIKDKKARLISKEHGLSASFAVPSSWRGPGTPNSNLINEKKYSVTTIQLPQKENNSHDQEPSLEEKLRILKEQENYTPPKPRYKSLNWEEVHRPSEVERKLCNWISLEINPLIGRLEGSRRSTSSIGKKLNAKSRRLNLWHEEFSHSAGRSAKAILLHNLVSSSRSKILETAAEKKLTSSDKEVCKPICHLLRVTLPYDIRASPRIAPEQQQNDIEKGGHGSARDKLADYSMLVESLRRQKDTRLDKEEARMLLCKGILRDNAQEYMKAIESYKEFLILCIKNGDKEGEATAYNFIGCSLQEEQDLKLAGNLEIPSTAAIQYEKAEEYHKLHAEIANLDGKFMAHTNLGLLYANLGKWSEAAVSHQIALKCATRTERPERQGVAVGNLGFTLFRQKEWATAKACMVKYLQICIALKDMHGQARAHYILGSIASERKRYEEATREFEAALKCARNAKDTKIERLSKIMVGVSQGDNVLEQQAEAL